MQYKTKCIQNCENGFPNCSGRKPKQTFVIDIPSHKRVLNFEPDYFGFSKLFLSLPKMHFYCFQTELDCTVSKFNCGVVFVRDNQYYYPTFTNVQNTPELNICRLEKLDSPPDSQGALRDISFKRLEAFYQSSFTTSNVDMFKINNFIKHRFVRDGIFYFFKDWQTATKRGDDFENQLFATELNNDLEHSGHYVGQKNFFDFYKSQLQELFD